MPISVLLPVYNAGNFLYRAINSVLTQTYGEFELVIIDDASVDKSAQIIRKFAQTDTRIRPIFHGRNVGLAETLNEGLAEARADLVVRMDQDDESLPQRLAVQLAYMQDNPDVVVSGSYVYHMGARTELDRMVEVPVTFEAILQVLPKYNPLYHPSVVLRRHEITALGGYRREFVNAEDYDLWLRASRVHRLANIPQALLRYRFSVGGMSLGRKWEQLTYVTLAQMAYQHPALPIDDVWTLTRAAVAEMDRKYFFREVAKATVGELARLGLWRDAAVLAWRLRTEIGTGRTMRYWREITRAMVFRLPPRPVL